MNFGEICFQSLLKLCMSDDFNEVLWQFFYGTVLYFRNNWSNFSFSLHFKQKKFKFKFLNLFKKFCSTHMWHEVVWIFHALNIELNFLLQTKELKSSVKSVKNDRYDLDVEFASKIKLLLLSELVDEVNINICFEFLSFQRFLNGLGLFKLQRILFSHFQLLYNSKATIKCKRKLKGLQD